MLPQQRLVSFHSYKTSFLLRWYKLLIKVTVCISFPDFVMTGSLVKFSDLVLLRLYGVLVFYYNCPVLGNYLF